MNAFFIDYRNYYLQIKFIQDRTSDGNLVHSLLTLSPVLVSLSHADTNASIANCLARSRVNAGGSSF